ncbi:MAG: protein-tyrosine phosphatase [Arenicella sp.]|jgi:protein-tyrosine phosphatase
MINFDRIEANIFLGSAPQSSIDVARLKQMKITAVLSLQSDADFKSHRIDWKKLQNAYQQNNISVQRFAIVDFDEVDLGNKLAEPVQALNALLAGGHRAYVHCNAGVCRAPATVLAYLCHYRGMSIQGGLEFLRRSRPQVHPYISAVEKSLVKLALSDTT